MYILLLLSCVFAATQEQKNLFSRFINDYHRNYTTAEYGRILTVFVDNLAEIERMNSLPGDATFGVTKFADISPEEFKRTYLTYKHVDRSETDTAPVLKLDGIQADAQIDWRQNGVVTPTYDQGRCGSCWAFSTVEALESQLAIKGKGLNQLSMQQLVSCDTQDAGCNGGDTCSGFEFVESNGGLVLASEYPYTSGSNGRSGSCQSHSADTGKISGYTWGTDACWSGSCNSQSESDVISAVSAYGPPAICVNAENWQYYTGGVMSDSQCGSHSARSLDHCVQLVGYKSDYWLVRNSWNTDWGYAGYIYLARGTNTCGVLDEVNFPTVV